MLRDRRHFAWLLLVGLLLSSQGYAGWFSRKPPLPCEAFLASLSYEKAGIYYFSWDPRHFLVRRRIRKEVEAQFPDLSQTDRDEIARYVYVAQRNYEKSRPELPPRAYGYWGLNFAFPALTMGTSLYLDMPKEFIPAVGLLSQYLGDKLLGPLGAKVQEKLNGRLGTHATSRPSAFSSNRSEVNTSLEKLADRASGAMTAYQDGADGKARALEVVLYQQLDPAQRAYRDGDRRLAVKFASNAAADVLARWTYVASDEPVLIESVRTFLSPMAGDKQFRGDLTKAVLEHPLVTKEGKLSQREVDHLLDQWIPAEGVRPAEAPRASLTADLEQDIRMGLWDARNAFKEGDRELALEFMGDVASDYLVGNAKGITLRSDLTEKIRRVARPFDAAFREDLVRETMSRRLIAEQGVTEDQVRQALQSWIP
jgi:hypothetical protein